VYAGEHAEAIASREQEVLQGWKELLAACEDARLHVSSTADALRFHSQARDLLSWMDGIAGQIGAADKPRLPLSPLWASCFWQLPPAFPGPSMVPFP
jgi:spectrin beta